ncbi:MAG TPA: site-2 protease family protein, partial [Polyangiaceae bacterium]
MAEKLPGLMVWYLVFVFTTTCHEAAHALVAYWGGDMTAYEGGHVTLDPVPHIVRSPVGMVLLPILSYLQMGWMLGFASVPVNVLWGKKHPGRQALMSFAGPFTNLLLALLALVAMRALIGAHVLRFSAMHGQLVEVIGHSSRSPLGAMAMGLGVMFQLNVLLFLFNLVPIPPLDGAGVLEGALPDVFGGIYDWMRRLPGIELLGVLLAWQVFSRYA